MHAALHLRRPFIHGLLALWLSGVWLGAAAADLRWERQAMDVIPAPSDSTVSGRFTFTNTGEQPVTVTKVKTSCGCTTAELEKKTYAPGESGSITAHLEIDRSWAGGEPVRKKIYVMTDEGVDGASRQSYVLTLGADVPQYVKQDEFALLWDAGDPVSTKSVVFEITHDEPIALKPPVVSSTGFTAKLTALEPGRRYQLDVTPTAMTKAFGDVTVSSDFPADAPFAYKVRLGIRAQPPEPGLVERAWNGLLRLIP